MTLWTIAYQAPLSVKLSRQEYGSGLPFHSPGDLLDPGIESRSPMLQADSLPTEPPGYKTKQETMLLNICTLVCVMELPQVAQWSRIYPPMQAMRIQSLGQEDLLEEGTATHSSILAWRILWTEKPVGLQSTGSQRVGHD